MTDGRNLAVGTIPFLVAKVETETGILFYVKPSNDINRPMAVALRKDGFDDLARLIHTPLRDPDHKPPTICRITGKNVDQFFVSANFDAIDWCIVDMPLSWLHHLDESEIEIWNRVVEAYLALTDRPDESHHEEARMVGEGGPSLVENGE